MRLEHLCDMELISEDRPILVRPDGGEEGTVYGQGTGRVAGERMRGTLRWTNSAHRRSDGAMLPVMRGAITTERGTTILFSMRGRTIWQRAAARPIGSQLMAVLFETADPTYRWLNDALCVLEGAVEPPTPERPRPVQDGVARVYLCVNELL